MADFVDDSSADFSQRSGMKDNGESKYLAKRHEIKFCVTVIDCNIKIGHTIEI